MKLYRMIICDDERMILDSLMKYVDWQALGFDVIALAEDGKDAIDLISREKIDVVLCDIMMHEVSGLDVAEYVNRENPDCEVVLLSGYQDFDYARRAISCNVYEYLLKPIKLSTVEEVFGKIKEKLDLKRQQEQERKLEQERILEFQQNAILKMIEMCKGGMLRTAKLLEEYLDDFGIAGEMLDSYVNELYIRIPDSVGEDIFLKEILENIFMLLQKKYLYRYPFVQYTNARNEYSVLILSENAFDKAALENFHRDIISSVSDICDVMAGILQRAVNERFRDYLLDLKQEFVWEEELCGNNNLQELTRNYIIEHISENVSLCEAANNCFLSPNYFCRLFKEQTGEKYSEFYIRIKMEYAAKLLIKTRKKIYEISDLLGYKNVKYFFKLFKRIYFCTPTEYRNHMTQQDVRE